MNPQKKQKKKKMCTKQEKNLLVKDPGFTDLEYT